MFELVPAGQQILCDRRANGSNVDMISDSSIAGDAISAEDVATLARIAGLSIAPADLSAVAVRLADLYALAADLDDLDLDGVESSARYDPRWSEEATA
jgi:hypothetical protein